MTPLDIITTLGPLLAEGRLVVERRGAWKAAWERRSSGLPMSCGSATSPEAAMDELADRLIGRARTDAHDLAYGDEEDRDLAQAIKLALAEVEEVGS